MKGKLEDGTLVDIEKPGAIEQDGKWWEFVGLREVKSGEVYLYNDNLFTAARDNEHRGLQKEYWIASEIPRATAEQLKAIGMKEGNGGRPVVYVTGEKIWTQSGVSKVIQGTETGRCRFVLVPDVQKEIHTSCEGCDAHSVLSVVVTEPCYCCYGTYDHPHWHSKEQPPQLNIYNYMPWISGGTFLTNFRNDEWGVYQKTIQSCGDKDFVLTYASPPMSADDGGSLHYLGKLRDVGHFWKIFNRIRNETQPTRPEEQRFSIDEACMWLCACRDSVSTNAWHLCINNLIDKIRRPTEGIAAFTERRRG